MRSLMRMATVALVFAAGVVWGAALPPEKGITLDFEWLSPPLITPDSAWGNVVRMDAFVRLSSRPGANQPSYSWSLRYPISIEDYPVLVLRYRASKLGLVTEPVLSVELTQNGGSLSVITGAELRQNDTVQEIRKDLGLLPTGAAIAQFRFVLPPAVAHLDIVEMSFEQARDMRPASVPMRQKVDFAVVDDYNRPVADATVRAGPLERKNWVTEARTDGNGRASLSVLSPGTAGMNGAMLGLSQPTEAAILRSGYAPQYVSSVDPARGELIATRLFREGQIPGVVPQALAPPPVEPVEQVEETTMTPPEDYYVDDRYYYDDYGYGRGYYPFGFVPGFVVVVREDGKNDDDDNGNGHGGNGNGGDDDNRGMKGSNPDLRTPPPPLPIGLVQEVPWPGQTSVASQGVSTVPGVGVTTVPRFGVQTAPRFGVQTAPRFGVQTAPRFGVVTAPSQGVVTAPSQGIVTAPGPGFTRSTPTPVVTAPRQVQAAPVRSFTPAPSRNVERTPVRIQRSNASSSAPRQRMVAPPRQSSQIAASSRSFSRPAPSVSRTPARVQLASPRSAGPAGNER